jgi:hypothetical protein
MLDKASIHAWITKYNIKTENGLPYDYENHLFWFDILNDWHPKQVWLKAAQVGGSLVANLKLMWAVKHFGMNSIYTMPTSADVKEFVGGKTNMLISQNPILQEWVKDKDTIEQKRIGDNIVYFRGTFTERAALSVSSDLNIHDEEDRSNRKVIDQYASRQQHSPYQWEWRFSNPSLIGAGVDAKWQLSDKREWFITCSHCEKEQYLKWPDNIDLEREMYVCAYCGGDIDKDRRKGAWKPTGSVDADWRGYHVNLMMAPWVPASKIINEFKTKSFEYFANFVLGLPFEGSGGKVTEEQFFSNLTEATPDWKTQVVIGMDTGLPNWYVVGTKYGAYVNKSCDGYDDVERLLQRFPKAIVVMDQGGDLIRPRELQEKYPGRIFLCYYRADRKAMTLIDWGKGVENGKVVADRNRVIQMLMDELRESRIPLFGTKEDWWEMWLHISNMYRVMEEDNLGQERLKWERVGPDHLFHALTYWRIGMDKFGMSEIGIVGSDMLENLGIKQGFTPEPGGGQKLVKPQIIGETDWRDV